MWGKAVVKCNLFSTVQLERKMPSLPFCSHWMDASQGSSTVNHGVSWLLD